MEKELGSAGLCSFTGDRLSDEEEESWLRLTEADGEGEGAAMV